MFRRRAKSLVGLDLGSSAVKAIELKPVGKGYKVVAFGAEPIPPDSIVDGTIIDSAAVAEAFGGCSRPQHQDQGRRRVALGQRRHRQEDLAARDDRSRAGRVDLLGSRAVHPVRHPGRQSRLPDSRQLRRRRQGDDGRPAGRREEGEDRRLHRRDRPGGPDGGGRRRRRLRAQNAYEVNYGVEPGGGRGAAQRRRQRDQHQHPERRAVGLHPRHLDRRQRVHRSAAARVEPAVRAGRPAEARPRR